MEDSAGSTRMRGMSPARSARRLARTLLLLALTPQAPAIAASDARPVLTACAGQSLQQCFDKARQTEPFVGHDWTSLRRIDEPAIAAGLRHELARNPSLSTSILYMNRYRGGGETAVAVGKTGHDSQEDARIDSPFDMASVQKTFTAVAIMRLVELQRMKLDDPIARHLPDEMVQSLIAGGYRPGEMTIAQVLSHTAGVNDLPFGSTLAAVWAVPELELSWNLSNSNQVKLLTRYTSPVAPPGERFSYASANYMLLEAVIEHVTGQNLSRAVRGLIDFERIGLRDTYYEDMIPRGLRTISQYVGAVDYSRLGRGYNYFGGMGIITTARDLSRFLVALMEGRIISKRSVELMKVEAVTRDPQKRSVDVYREKRQTNHHHYGLGLTGFTVGDQMCYGHGGSSGVVAVVCPDLGLSFVRVLNNRSVWTDESAFVAPLGRIAQLAARKR